MRLAWAHETGRRGKGEMEGEKGRGGGKRKEGYVSLERQEYKELKEMNYNAL